MAVLSAKARAFNQTRQVFLAREVALANTHWTRLRGLVGTAPDDFRNGRGIWIVPCHGVHTLGMGFPIDVVYLDRAMKVIHVQTDLRPWRFAPVRTQAASVLELPCGTAAETRTAVGDRIQITVNEVTIAEATINEIPINELTIAKDGRVPTA